MKKFCFKSRIMSKQGSVLFIVLVIMSFMVILASAVYYTVMNGRQNVVMEYSDAQAFQSANDVLNGMQNNLIWTDTPNMLHDVVFGAQCGASDCSPCDSTCDLTLTGGPAVCNKAENCNKTLGFDIKSAKKVWASNHGATLEELIGSGAFVNGVHYVSSTSPSVLPGGGNANIIIYVNRYGDIVVEVTVDYNGKRVTTSRVYDKEETIKFTPKWRNLYNGDVETLHWKWRKDRTNIEGPEGFHTAPQPGPEWKLVGALGPFHFLDDKYKYVSGSENSWAKRVGIGDCMSYEADGVTPKSDPLCTASVCFEADGITQSGRCFRNACRTEWDACYTGNGWWYWVSENSVPVIGTTTPITTQFQGVPAPWRGVKWTEKDGNWVIGKRVIDDDGNPITYEEDEFERGSDGVFTFKGPGGFTWQQRDAFHITGLTESEDSLNWIMNRGTCAPVFYDTEWTILNGQHLGTFRGDISAANHLVLARAFVINPSERVPVRLQVTAGKDLHIMGMRYPGSPITALRDAGNRHSGGLAGNIDVKVGGDMYAYAKDKSNYFSTGVNYYVLGDLYLGDSSNSFTDDTRTKYNGSSNIYVYGKVYQINNYTNFTTNATNTGGVTERDVNYITATDNDGRSNIRIHKMSDEMYKEIKEDVVYRTGDGTSVSVEDFPVSDSLPSARNKVITWGYCEDETDDWDYDNWDYCTATAHGTKRSDVCSRYGVCIGWGGDNGGSNRQPNIHPTAQAQKSHIYYINDDATITNVRKNTFGQRYTDAGIANILMIDTGVGAAAKTITLNLNGFLTVSGVSGNVFQWKNGLSSTDRMMILTLGDGSVVFNVPDGTTYRQGKDYGGVSYIGPYNLAVQGEYTNTTWVTDSRLSVFSKHEDFQAAYSEGNQLNPAYKDEHGTACINSTRNCRFSCFLYGLLETDGSGKLRSCGKRDEPHTCSSNICGGYSLEEIRPRGHTIPLNVNIYLVNNHGMKADGTAPILIKEDNLFVGVVYAPKMTFNYVNIGNGNRAVIFGSLFVAQLTVDTHDHFISVLPGGGLGGGGTPKSNGPKSSGGTGAPDESPLTPVGGEENPWNQQ